MTNDKPKLPPFKTSCEHDMGDYWWDGPNPDAVYRKETPDEKCPICKPVEPSVEDKEKEVKKELCPVCRKLFVFGVVNVGQSCCVFHNGGCCHFNDMEVERDKPSLNEKEAKHSAEWLKEKLKHCDGQDCDCYAHGQHECGCDADWTPKEVYVLRYELSSERTKREEAEKELETERLRLATCGVVGWSENLENAKVDDKYKSDSLDAVVNLVNKLATANAKIVELEKEASRLCKVIVEYQNISDEIEAELSTANKKIAELELIIEKQKKMITALQKYQ